MKARGDVRASRKARGATVSSTTPAPGRSARVLVEKVLPIARERAQLAGQMRDALERGDEGSALQLLRKYLGLPTLEATT